MSASLSTRALARSRSSVRRLHYFNTVCIAAAEVERCAQQRQRRPDRRARRLRWGQCASGSRRNLERPSHLAQRRPGSFGGLSADTKQRRTPSRVLESMSFYRDHHERCSPWRRGRARRRASISWRPPPPFPSSARAYPPRALGETVNAYIEKKLQEELGRLSWRPLSFSGF
jgi:hypothetical protein